MAAGSSSGPSPPSPAGELSASAQGAEATPDDNDGPAAEEPPGGQSRDFRGIVTGSGLQDLIRVSRGMKTLRDMRGVDGLVGAERLSFVREIARGGYGQIDLCIYEAEDGTETEVAVKRILARRVADPSKLKRFSDECRLLRKLRHQHVVDYIGIVQDTEANEQEGSLDMLLVQEFCSGGSLWDRLIENVRACGTYKPVPLLKTYSAQEALGWLVDVAKGLHYLHSASPRVIHRDLKPENVFLRRLDSGKVQAMLGDFGLSAVVDSKLQDVRGWQHEAAVSSKSDRSAKFSKLHSMSSTLSKRSEMGGTEEQTYQLTGKVGSLAYMAPELLRDEQYNEKVDIYALGCILFEMMVGCSIGFAVVTSELTINEDLEEYISRVGSGGRVELPPYLPLEVCRVIVRLWSQDAGSRPSAAEAIGLLRSLLPLADQIGTAPPSAAALVDGTQQAACCGQCGLM